MAKTFKTKLVLGILAATLTLSLAIGGTLMLFTDTSNTATNTVTLGNAYIELQESDSEEYDEESFLTVGENGFTGFDFGETIVPGDLLNKRPIVVNTGTVPVKVFVDGTFMVNDGEYDLSDIVLSINDLNDADGTNNEAAYARLDATELEILSIIQGVSYEGTPSGLLGPDWSASMVVSDGKNMTGTYYYNAILEPDDPTSEIFTQIQIPEEVTNLLRDYSITLKLTAYAVQSANTDEWGADLKALFLAQ